MATETTLQALCTSTRRLLAPFAIAAALPLGFACGDGRRDPPSPAAPTAPSSATIPEEPEGPEAEPSFGEARVDLTGHVATDIDEPIVGRRIVVLDAAGRRTEALSDADGVFEIVDVRPPYDVLVERAPSGPSRVPTVFVGLWRPDPWLELYERESASVTRPAPQAIRVGVRVPPCPSGTCQIAVVSASKTGGGLSAASYVGLAASPMIFDLAHTWNRAAIPAGEEVTVHALVSDAARASYAYGSLAPSPARPGEPGDLGVLEVAPVPSTEPVRIDAWPADDVPGDWASTLATWLDLPGGAVIPLAYDEEVAGMTVRLPILAGASVRAIAWASHPATPDKPYFHRSAQARSGRRAIASIVAALAAREEDRPSFSVAPTSGPVAVRPGVDGILSARAPKIAWSSIPEVVPVVGGARAVSPSASPTVATLTIVDIHTGATRFRVVTDRPEVSLARLADLGVRRLTPGEHVFDLASSPGRVDEAVDPDVTIRRRFDDPTRAGSRAYQRFRFVVTP